MDKSPFHGDKSRLTPVERNWGKYDAEKRDGCRCGLRNGAQVERVTVDRTGQRIA